MLASNKGLESRLRDTVDSNFVFKPIDFNGKQHDKKFSKSPTPKVTFPIHYISFNIFDLMLSNCNAIKQGWATFFADGQFYCSKKFRGPIRVFKSEYRRKNVYCMRLTERKPTFFEKSTF